MSDILHIGQTIKTPFQQKKSYLNLMISDEEDYETRHSILKLDELNIHHQH